MYLNFVNCGNCRRSRSTRSRIFFWRRVERTRDQWKSRGARMWWSSRFVAQSICTHFVCLILTKLISWSNLFLPVWLFKICRLYSVYQFCFTFLNIETLGFVIPFYGIVIYTIIWLFLSCYEIWSCCFIVYVDLDYLILWYGILHVLSWVEMRVFFLMTFLCDIWFGEWMYNVVNGWLGFKL